MTVEDRLKVCEEATEETFQQIKTLQNRHQQLIGYKQALMDVLQDKKVQEEYAGLQQSVESIASTKKSKQEAA